MKEEEKHRDNVYYFENNSFIRLNFMLKII